MILGKNNTSTRILSSAPRFCKTSVHKTSVTMTSQIVIPMHVYGPDENEIRLQTSENFSLNS